MFSIRLRPLQDEGLQSFMYRFAKVNGISFLDLWNLVRKNVDEYVKSNDKHLIDLSPDSVINMTSLSKWTNISEKRLYAMTFFNIIQMFDSSDGTHRSRFLKKIVRKTLCYCPKCIQKAAYLSILWKIESITYCEKHQCALQQICPHCQANIDFASQAQYRCLSCEYDLCSDIKDTQGVDTTYQVWLIQTWKELLEYHKQPLSPSKIAWRMLYLYDQTDWIHVSSNTRQSLRSELLKLCKNKTSSRRSIPLKRLLLLLFNLRMSPVQFFDLQVPSDFLSVFLSPPTPLYTCQAPWCTHYNSQQSLKLQRIKYKKLKSGIIRKQYMFCPACYCQYYIDEDHQLREKTYFIQGYTELKEGVAWPRKFRTLAWSSLQRCQAYFASRNFFTDGTEEYNTELIQSMIRALQQGTSINDVAKWTCWTHHSHFLKYRYHTRILSQQMYLKRKRRCRRNDKQVTNLVRKICKQNIHHQQTITIEQVSHDIHMTSNTLRTYKGAYQVVQHYKSLQKEQYKEDIKKHIKQRVKQYFDLHQGEAILSVDLFASLNISQSYLHAYLPELNQYIYEQKQEHHIKYR